MNQINLDKLLQNPMPGVTNNSVASSGELKLLVGELYNARLQTLSDAGQLQLQTPQGKLTVTLPPQLGQQISQQFGQQLQVSLSPAANNQLSLNLQSLPAAISNIIISPAQLQPVLSQWLSSQLPQLTSGVTVSSPATGNQPPQQAGSLSNQSVSATSSTQQAPRNLTMPLQLELKTGQLQLAGSSANNAVLLTLSNKELAAFNKLNQAVAASSQASSQPTASPPAASGRQAVSLNISFNQGSAGIQLSIQPAGTTPALPLTAASQQQLLQALVSQLAPIRQTVAPDAVKITLGQLSISIPPKLAAALASSQQAPVNANASASPTASPANPATSALPSGAQVPLLLQLQAPVTQSGNWQVMIQTAGQSQQLTIQQGQADRPLNWQANSKGQLPSSPTLNAPAPGMMSLAPETKVQAWRNLLPLLSQPLMQANSLPNLPAPLQQLFSQVQQSLPEISKPLAAPALATQLNALLQFQPLQAQPNVQTTGGTLALAIQLLLGHLSQKQLTPANNPPANRLSQLVSQLDAAQAGSALRQLASLSSPLQQSQLATLDSQSQLQQWLLQLPLQQQGQTIMPQLMLEQREADGKSGEKGQKQWQLTMKFDLQQYGNLLAVAKLQQQDLQLQFYTDHNEALRLAQKFLPLLKDRCAAQGLTVSQADCQLGKIPDSLLPRHNSLLTVKV